MHSKALLCITPCASVCILAHEACRRTQVVRLLLELLTKPNTKGSDKQWQAETNTLLFQHIDTDGSGQVYTLFNTNRGGWGHRVGG